MSELQRLDTSEILTVLCQELLFYSNDTYL